MTRAGFVAIALQACAFVGCSDSENTDPKVVFDVDFYEGSDVHHPFNDIGKGESPMGPKGTKAVNIDTMSYPGGGLFGIPSGDNNTYNIEITHPDDIGGPICDDPSSGCRRVLVRVFCTYDEKVASSEPAYRLDWGSGYYILNVRAQKTTCYRAQ